MNSARGTQAWVEVGGRSLLGLPFLVAGIEKITRYGVNIAYMTKYGVPMPELLIVASMIVEIGGAALLVAGWKARWAALALAAFAIVVSFVFHRFWAFDEPQFSAQLFNFLKNLAIVGGLLYLAAHGAGAVSLDSRAERPAS